LYGASSTGDGYFCGIYKSGGTPTTVIADYNTIKDNTLAGTVGGAFYGIRTETGTTQSASNNSIYNNVIAGTGTGGGAFIQHLKTWFTTTI